MVKSRRPWTPGKFVWDRPESNRLCREGRHRFSTRVPRNELGVSPLEDWVAFVAVENWVETLSPAKPGPFEPPWHGNRRVLSYFHIGGQWCEVGPPVWFMWNHDDFISGWQIVAVLCGRRLLVAGRYCECRGVIYESGMVHVGVGRLKTCESLNLVPFYGDVESIQPSIVGWIIELKRQRFTPNRQYYCNRHLKLKENLSKF